MPLKRIFAVNSGNAREVRVNVLTAVNSDDIREETDVNGRLCWVISSATLPDNVVMNDILYPADEIEKGYKTLEGTPAPLGHPMVGGEYVSALHPEAYPYLTGAINRNVKRENGRVFVEKWIDKEFAQRNHSELVEAIEKRQPIHTSTGLLLTRTPAASGKGYKFVASNMEFDHDAILLNEVGAAQPSQGVGMFVNSSGQKIEVINSELNSEKHDALQDALPADAWLMDFDESVLYYGLESENFEQEYKYENGVAELVGKPYTVKRVTLWERIVNAVTKPKIKSNDNEVVKMDEETKAALDAISGSITALTEKVEGLATKVEAIESATQETQQAAANAQAAKEAELRKVVAERLGETVANALTGEALTDAHAKLTSGKAADVASGAPDLETNSADKFAAPDPATYFAQ